MNYSLRKGKQTQGIIGKNHGKNHVIRDGGYIKGDYVKGSMKPSPRVMLWDS